jgi:dihydroneopterin aldolase
MDCIHLRAIRAYGYVGFLPEEQVLGQWFEVDLTLWIDLKAAGVSDRIEDTHDYRMTIQVVQRLVETSRFKLLETLAEAIATQILHHDPRLEQVRVQLTKLSPPIPGFTGQITIDIHRMQAS